MKFKDFQAPVLFSSTFKALNLGEKNQVLSRMRGNPDHHYNNQHHKHHHYYSYHYHYFYTVSQKSFKL